MKITYLDEEKKFDQFINKKIMVDFYAEWCGPCKMLGEVLKNVDTEIECLKVNVDEFSNIAQKYGVMSIPTIIIFDNNKEIKKNIGFMDEEELIEFIEKS